MESQSATYQESPEEEQEIIHIPPPAAPEMQAEQAPVHQEPLTVPKEPQYSGSIEDAMTHLAAAIDRSAAVLNACADQVNVGKKREGRDVSFVGTSDVSFGASGAIDLGPLQPLVDDDTINDILVNGPDQVYVERSGQVQLTDVRFSSHQELFELANNIVAAVGRKLDNRRPLVDARLLDGSRVNIVAPPLAIDGVSISIRKFAKEKITLDSMVQSGCLSEQLANFLKIAAQAKVNMVICGGTGSGKTTLLNAISQHIRIEDRIVTIEDSAELQLQQPHIVRLETKIPDVRSNTDEEVNMRDLVKNALRMRPDRIIVGEVRGPEAFDMIQAMNTGHDGSLTTIHANTPRDGLSRIENMISMANLNIPPMAIRKQIASAVHLIVQTARMEDGVRRVTEVSELVGMEGEVPQMQDLFKFRSQGQGPDGKLQGTQAWSQVFPRHTQFTKMLRESGVIKV